MRAFRNYWWTKVNRAGVNMAEKQYYCKLRLSYKGAFDAFSDSGAAALIRAILHYASDGNEINIPPEVVPTWEIIKDDLKRDNEDFQNGKKGGRPRMHQQPMQPDEEAEIDQPTFMQAIKYGFSETDAQEIGRFKNTPYLSQFVDDSMEVCYDREKTTLSYFIGIMKNKSGY